MLAKDNYSYKKYQKELKKKKKKEAKQQKKLNKKNLNAASIGDSGRVSNEDGTGIKRNV